MVTFIGGSGHLNPLVPIVQAAAEAGHDVLLLADAFMIEPARRLGVPVEQLGEEPASPPERLPAQDPDPARERKVLHERFVLDGTRTRVPQIEAVCARWRPDILLVEELNFGGMLAGERLGLPYATVQVIVPGTFVRPQIMGDVFDQVRAEHGLPPDPTMATITRHLLLTPFPPSYHPPEHPLPPNGHAFRPAGPVGPAARVGEPPAWTRVRPGAPTVYFTLGTVFNMESGDLFDRVLAGLADLPVNALATVGPHIDPAEFGPQPNHVRVERYVPQDSVLPWCDLVLSHGGSGTVMGSLTHGLPSVIMPLGADQPHNAARCRELGAGITLDPVTLTPQRLCNAVAEVLAEPAHRSVAQKVGDEIGAQSSPAEIVALLERQVASS